MRLTKELKRDLLKKIIKSVHNGTNVEDAKNQFRELVSEVTAVEISEVEQELIDEGLPEEEVKRFCDIHVEVMRDGLSKPLELKLAEEHPIDIFIRENKEISRKVNSLKQALKNIETVSEEDIKSIHEDLIQLLELEKHYLRKENLLFPYLEKYNFTGPSQVMWGIHDDIRSELKKVISHLESSSLDPLQIPGLTTSAIWMGIM